MYLSGPHIPRSVFFLYLSLSLSGNLYYALTHSPEPMTKEFSHALSWQAATERLEAAGSIPVEEARLMEEALSSNDARVEVSIQLKVFIIGIWINHLMSPTHFLVFLVSR